MEINTIKRNFAKNLIALRKSKNWNQAQLGEQIHYSYKNISKWENEESIPDIDVLTIIAETFNVKVDDLISEENIIKKSHKNHNRLLVTLLSAFLPFILSLIVYVILHFVEVPKDYYSFMGGAIVSAITCIVLTSIWYKKIWICVSIIYLIWAISLLLIFVFDFYLFWMFLIIAPVLSLGTLLLFRIKFH